MTILQLRVGETTRPGRTGAAATADIADHLTAARHPWAAGAIRRHHRIAQVHTAVAVTAGPPAVRTAVAAIRRHRPIARALTEATTAVPVITVALAEEVALTEAIPDADPDQY
jgi:hypothetical protein